MVKKNYKYPAELKTEICDYALQTNIKKASAVYNVPRNSIGRWLEQYRKHGEAGLNRKSYGTEEQKISSGLLAKLKEFKDSHPEITLTRLREKFKLKCSISLLSVRLKTASGQIKSNEISKEQLETEIKDPEKLLSKGLSCYYAADYLAALQYFKTALAFCKRDYEKNTASEINYYISLIYSVQLNTAKAKKYLEMSAAVVKETDDPLLQYMYFRAMYSLTVIEKDYTKAEEYSCSCMKSANETHDRNVIGYCMNIMQVHNYLRGDYDSYIKKMTEAAEYNNTNSNVREYYNSLENLFNVYVYYKYYDSRTIDDIYRRLKDYSEKTGNESIKFRLDHKKGVHYFMLNDLKRAEQLLTRCLSASLKYSTKETEMSIYLYLAHIEYRNRELLKAVKCLNILVSDAVKVKSKFYELHALMMLADIFLRRGDRKRSSACLRRSIRLAEDLKDYYHAGKSRYLYACNCQTSGRLHMAEYNLKRTIFYLKEQKNDNYRDTAELLIASETKLDKLYDGTIDSYEILAKINKRKSLKEKYNSLFFHLLLLYYSSDR
ncbi:MAG TPA: helix-turn-helix domain containing protein [Clostridiales bacterium]|nr:helix-turn-helix domain containing protein [Clostridiales bacterium]HQP70953.1 helix-turn-helix domain containing protein [Clostridiales bacterium]